MKKLIALSMLVGAMFLVGVGANSAFAQSCPQDFVITSGEHPVITNQESEDESTFRLQSYDHEAQKYVYEAIPSSITLKDGGRLGFNSGGIPSTESEVINLESDICIEGGGSLSGNTGSSYGGDGYYTANLTGEVTLVSGVLDINTGVLKIDIAKFKGDADKINIIGSKDRVTIKDVELPTLAKVRDVKDKLPNSDLGVADDETITFTGERKFVTVEGVLKGNGKASSITVRKGGKLYGTHTVANTITVEEGGELSPGNSPGCITTGAVYLFGGAVYNVELGGTTACSQHDQIILSGESSGAHPLSDSAKLNISVISDFVPKAGNEFVIIKNPGTNSLPGGSFGLDEADTITADGVTFKVSYKGGDGNDMVLGVTDVNAAKLAEATGNRAGLPDTAGNSTTSNALIMLGIISAASIALIVASRKWSQQ